MAALILWLFHEMVISVLQIYRKITVQCGSGISTGGKNLNFSWTIYYVWILGFSVYPEGLL